MGWKKYLLPMLLFCACLMVVPCAQELRLHRMVNFVFLMTLAASLCLCTVDVPAGLLSVLAVLQISRGGDILSLSDLLCLVGYYLAMSSEEFDKEFFYDAIIAVALVNVAWQIMQWAGVFFILSPETGASMQYAGLMGNVNDMSDLLAISSPVFFRGKRKRLVPILVLGLALARSWQGVVAVSTVVIVWSSRNLGLRYGAASVVLALVLLFTFHVAVKPLNIDNNLKTRGVVWVETARAALERPLTGWGFGQFGKIMNPRINQSETWMQAHNEYVEWFFIAGVPGLVLMALFLSKWFYTSWGLPDQIPVYGVIAACVCSVFGFPWHVLPNLLLTATYLALPLRDRKVL